MLWFTRSTRTRWGQFRGLGCFVFALGMIAGPATVPRPVPSPAVPLAKLNTTYEVTGCQDSQRLRNPQHWVQNSFQKACSTRRLEPLGLKLPWAVADHESVANVQVNVVGDRLRFKHKIWHTCCAEISVESSLKPGVGPLGRSEIRAIERDRGEVCRCMCNFDVTATIDSLPPGNYDFRVYAEVRQDGQAGEPVMLFERGVVVPERSELPQRLDPDFQDERKR